MAKIVMYAHGGSKNHGCEAIIRASAEILKEIDDHPILLSYNTEEDLKYGLDKIVEVRQELGVINKKSPDFLKAYFWQKVKHNYHLMDGLMHKEAIESLPQVDIACFVGGDNYCYSNVKNYKVVNDFMQKKAKKLVLWGTSVEPELLDDVEIRKDIQRFDYIVARESISYEALKKVNPNTCLLPDPAFYLPMEKVELPEGFERKNTIGLNVSPLVMRLEKQSGNILRNYENLIEHILKTTRYSIALIPHVVWDGNDDREPLQYLYDKYKTSERMIMVDDHSCMQQKYIISQCKMFIGARTHATIAAYSTGVPTVVVGYSVKARGIARDLFGTEENYLVPAQKMEQDDELVRAFEWLQEHESEVSKRLLEKKKKYSSYRSEYVKVISNEK